LISSLFSLPLFTVACGDGNSEKTKTLEECEEACLELDACDDTFEYPGGDYCADTCDAGWDAYEDLGCTAKFEAIASCRSAGNSCPVPDCLSEIRDLEECVDEGTPDEPVGSACETLCSDAAECVGAGDDYDEDACEQDCEDGQDISDDLGCGTEYSAYIGCVDPCDAEASEDECAVELEELTACAAGD
jgi:hypothetical protein